MKNLIVLMLLTTLFEVVKAQTTDIINQAFYEPDLIISYKKQIGLSPEQESKIRTIYLENNTVFNDKKGEWASQMQAFRESIEGRPADTQKANRIFKEILALESVIKELKLNSLMLIKNELSAEQQQQLDNIKETNPQYVKAFELNLGSSADGTKITIQNKQESTFSEQEKAVYFLIGNGMKKTLEFVDMNEISHGDIESISVFKGETAIEKYGQQGKDGVVEVKIKESAVSKYFKKN